MSPTTLAYDDASVNAVDDSRWFMLHETKTQAPAQSWVSGVADMLGTETHTRSARPRQLRKVVVYSLSPDAMPDADISRTSKAMVLASAVADLGEWLSLSQTQVAQLVGLSPSTVMAWKRQPETVPRHVNIGTLLRLWAAVAGAREELGDKWLTVTAWQPGNAAKLTAGSANELADILEDLADQTSNERLHSALANHAPEATSAHTDLASAEREISESLASKFTNGEDDVPWMG